MAQLQVREGRALDRLVNFSDAVVAVAITVQILPIVDIPGPAEGQNIVGVLREHSSQITTFLFTFAIVAILWSVHNRVMNVLQSFDATIFWLDMAWLAGFVFLPWPSALLGAGGHLLGQNHDIDGGVPALYWITMGYISGIGLLTTMHVNRHPELIDPSCLPAWQFSRTTRARYRGLAFTVLFLCGGVVSYFWAPALFLIPLLIVALELLLRPTRAEQAAFDALSDAHQEGDTA